MSRSKWPELIVRNVVSSMNLTTRFDCHELVEALHGRYDRVVFPAVVSKCKETRTTNSCFASGKVVVSGAKSESHALLSAHLLILQLHVSSSADEEPHLSLLSDDELHESNDVFDQRSSRLLLMLTFAHDW